MKHYILDPDGNPVVEPDLLVWARWFEASDELRRISDDTVGDVRISTVFLGLNLRLGRGTPLLYETMIFGGEHDEYCNKYSDRESALRGHARAVAKVEG